MSIFTPYNALLIGLLSIVFTLPIRSTANEQVLASISHHLDTEFHTEEGNYFRLIRLNPGCQIEARFYTSMQNILYHFTFTQDHLIAATVQTFKYRYVKDHEGSLGHVTDQYQDSSARYDLNDLAHADIKKDFIRYKALFSTEASSKC